MYKIDFHADDYAASIENSKAILELAKAGRIDSFSVIMNMGCCEECMRLLRENWSTLPRKPLLSVHINLIDGFWLSSPEGQKIIRHSWGQLFFRSMIPGEKRNILRDACSREIEAQIRAFLEKTADLPDAQGHPGKLRIDSHVHTHMIPMVFQALREAIDRMGIQSRISFIRCSAEPLSMFLLTPGVTETISLVNLAKNLILKLLSRGLRKHLLRMKIETGRIFGIAMTGEMDSRRVSLILPKMISYAKRKDSYLEVLSHPGRSVSDELSDEWGPDDRKAFISPKRDMEFRMLMEIHQPEVDRPNMPKGGDGGGNHNL